LKVPKSRRKKAAVRKTSAGRRSKRLQEEQSSMPPVRVFADAPGGRKRHLEPVDEVPSKRATRRTSSEVSATNNEDTPPRNNRRSSPQIDERIDEGSTVRRDACPTSSAVMGHQQFDSDGFLDPEVELDDEGKFLLDSCPHYLLPFLFIFLNSFGCVLLSDMIFVCMLFSWNHC
jgi:hypothetical protein